MNPLNYKQIKLKSLLPYLGFFLVLLAGSGLVKIPVGSAWFYVIKFGIIAAVLGIGVSAWWKAKMNNLPPTTYLKLALFVPFTIDFHLHYAFIFLTIILFNKKLLLPWNSPLKPIYLLFIWGFISYVINQFIEFNPLSFPFFIFTFFLSIILFSLFYIVNIDKTLRYEIINHYYTLVLLVIWVIILQIALNSFAHPDRWDGGTGDAHYAAAFLSIAFMISFILLIKNKDGVKNLRIKEKAILLLTFPILFMIDAKLFLVLLVFFVLITVLIQIIKKTTQRIVYLLLISIVLVGWYNYSKELPISILYIKGYHLNLQEYLDNLSSTRKTKYLLSAINTPFNAPVIFVIGSGPGTFLSKASFDKKIIHRKISIPVSDKYIGLKNLNVHKLLEPVNSKTKLTYSEPDIEKQYYGGIFYSWRSTVLTMFFELGIIGLILFFWFYKTVIDNSKNDRVIYLIIVSIITMHLINDYFNYWSEFASYSMILYGILGLFINPYTIEEKRN